MKGSITPLTMALKHLVEGPEEEMLTRGGSISAGIRKLGSLAQKEHYEIVHTEETACGGGPHSHKRVRAMQGAKGRPPWVE